MKCRNSVLAISLVMLSLALCGSRGETAIQPYDLTVYITGVMAVPVQVVPQVIHGSLTDMGCTSALVDSGDVMTCNSQSYLVDGCSPDIDTSTSDWASDSEEE